LDQSLKCSHLIFYMCVLPKNNLILNCAIRCFYGYKNQSLVSQTSKGEKKTWCKQNIDPA